MKLILCVAALSTAAGASGQVAQSILTPTTPVKVVPAVAAAPVAPVAPAMPVAIIATPTGGDVLRTGTELSLKTAEYLSTEHKALRVGQRVRMEVGENVTLGGRIVIPAGSPAEAEITDVRNKGMWGKSGHFVGRVLHVRVGDRQIRLTGAFDDHGSTGTGGVVAAVVFLPIAGFVMTGTSAKMPIGTTIKAFLDEDLRLAN